MKYEVLEYLRFSNSPLCYIKTGVVVNGDMGLGFKIKWVSPSTSDTQYKLIYGWRKSTAIQYLINYLPSGAGFVFDYWSTGGRASSGRVDSNFHIYDVVPEETVIAGYLDGVKKGTITKKTDTGLEVYLGGSNINGTYSNRTLCFDCGASWIYDNQGNIIQYLVPVKVNGVGYMYDKVSKQLFGNSGTGTFIMGPATGEIIDTESGMPKVSILRRKLLKFMPKYKPNYLCFTAIDKGTFSYTITSGFTTSLRSYVEYSIDDCNTWTRVNNVNNEAITVTTPEITPGKKVYWKGIGTTSANNNGFANTGRFSSTGRFNVSGVLASFFYGDNFTESSKTKTAYYAARLFYSCTGLIHSKDLILSPNNNSYVYYDTFSGCTNMLTTPSLSNMGTLYEGCYRNMFYNCKSITILPLLPNTVLASQCYYNMFYGCTGITSIPLDYLPATTLKTYCYGGMFQNCTNITTAPDLPATTLVAQCYMNMFYGCTKLNYIKMLATNISATLCLTAWMYEVQTTSGTFIRNPEATWIVVGQHGIQTNWTWFDGTESENDETITFVDPEVQRIMVAQWGGKMGGAAAGSTRKCGIGTSTATGIKRGGYADGIIYKKQVENIVTVTSQFINNTTIVDFSDFNKLTSLTIIDNGTSACGFYNCTNLKYITLPDTVTCLGKDYDYSRGCFMNTAIESIYITDNVTTTDDFVFKGCSKLKTIRWGNKLPWPPTLAGNTSSFLSDCSNLETITNFPQNAIIISDRAFNNCPKLDFSILDFTKIATIGQYAFAYDTQLPKNLMLLNCRTLGSYFIRDTGTHNLYLPYIRSTNSQHILNYSSVNIIDYGQDYSSGYINFQNMANNQAIVLRSLSPKNGTAARFTLYSNGSTMARLYVYPEVLDEYKETYTAIASKTYAIGGTEWEAQFGSTNEWADYPDSQAPDVYLSESKVEWVSLARNSVINTSVVPTSNTHVIIRGNYSTVANTIIAGTHQSNSLRFYMGAVSNTFRFAIGSVEYNTTVPYDSNIHTFEMYGNGKAVLDGTEYATGGTLGTTTTTLTLFGRHTTGTTYNAYATTFRLYSAQIYEGDELIKDYEPYRRRGGIYLHEKVADVYDLIGYIDNTLFGDEIE